MFGQPVVQDISVLTISGDIDFREATSIKNSISALIEKGRVKVVLDLRGVDHVNYLSTGILMTGLKNLHAQNGNLKIVTNLWVKDILAVTGVGRYFEEYISVDAAIESFQEHWEGAECATA